MGMSIQIDDQDQWSVNHVMIITCNVNNIFTMFSSSRDSNKLAIGNVIKVYNSSVCIQS